MKQQIEEEITWWTCRNCGRVRAYTALDLRAMSDMTPVCNLCDVGVRHVMQKICYDAPGNKESEVQKLTTQLDAVNKTVAGYMTLTDELDVCNKALCAEVANRNKHVDELQSALKGERESRDRQTETLREATNDARVYKARCVGYDTTIERSRAELETAQDTNERSYNLLRARNVQIANVKDLINHPCGRSYQQIIDQAREILEDDKR